MKPNNVHVINWLVSCILKSPLLITDLISQYSSNHYPTCRSRVCFGDGTKCCLCNCLVSCLVKYLLLITDHISQHSSSFSCLWEQGFIVMKPNVYLRAVPYLTYKPKSGSMKKKHPCLSHMVSKLAWSNLGRYWQCKIQEYDNSAVKPSIAKYYRSLHTPSPWQLPMATREWITVD